MQQVSQVRLLWSSLRRAVKDLVIDPLVHKDRDIRITRKSRKFIETVRLKEVRIEFEGSDKGAFVLLALESFEQTHQAPRGKGHDSDARALLSTARPSSVIVTTPELTKSRRPRSFRIRIACSRLDALP